MGKSNSRVEIFEKITFLFKNLQFVIRNSDKMSLQEKILKRKLKKKEKQKLKVIEDRKAAKSEETEEDSQIENEVENESIEENESKSLKRNLEDSENLETPAPPAK